MINQSTRRVIHGAVINPISLEDVRFLPHCLIFVGEHGRIELIKEEVKSSEVQEAITLHGWDINDVDLITLESGTWLMPGFVDTHTHAPQYPNLGKGGDMQLLEWLQNVTFPEENKFQSREYAVRAYPSTVRTTLSFGTTTCCYYGTFHLEATKVLVDTVRELGQRAFVGKCNLDDNDRNEYNEESATTSLEETEEIIKYIRYNSESINNLPPQDSALVHPIVTPRFALGCTAELLEGLGKMAAEQYPIAIQTHISENLDEICITKSKFGVNYYADAYDKFGLITDRTVLAHGCYLEDYELELIKQRKAGVSHCPTSNFNLRSGLANVGRWLDRGIKVGLGSDVSGGFAPSIITAVQHASICSKVRSLQPSSDLTLPVTYEGKQLSVRNLIYLATMGGASVCGLADTIGNFEKGKEFDALLVDLRASAGNAGVWPEHEPSSKESLLASAEKFLFCGDDRNIAFVFVRNRIVAGNRAGLS